MFEILDYLPVGVFVLEPDWRVNFWNNRLEEWTGISRETLLGQPIYQYFPHLRDTAYRARIQSVFEQGTPVILSSHLHNHLLPVSLPDNAPQVQHTTIMPVPAPETANRGGFYALFTIEDVTELTHRTHKYREMRDKARQAEQTLRERERQLREAQAIAQVGSWYINHPTHTLAWSDETYRIFGIAPGKKLTFKDFVRCIYPDDRDKVIAAWQEALGAHIYYDVKHRILRAGETRWIHGRAETTYDASGQPLESLGTVQDITLRNQVEDALLRARDEAEAANRAKSAFIANMSHELRTPLNAVLGFAQILVEDPSLNEHQQDLIRGIQRGGDYLFTLINDILDLAKIEAGRFELFPRAWSTESFFHGLSEMFRLRAAQKNIHFSYQIQASLPSMLYLDDKRLRQIAMNLLGNAVKFTEQGSVVLSASHEAGHLIMEIRDSGVGIPPEQLSRIFQPFHQVGTDYYKSQGTGLGLAITHKLLTVMGGELQVESRPGHGSVFRARIPAKAAEPSEQVETVFDPSASIKGYHRLDGDTPFRVLIVDDAEDNRKVMRGLLHHLGFITEEAVNGRQGLERICARPPDLVFMDLRMPVMNGLEATRKLRQSPEFKTLPIIAVSAGAFHEDQAQSRNAGCDGYLTKPIKRHQLLAELSRHLGLEWRHVPGEASLGNEKTLTVLDPEQRKSLLQLARNGDIGGVLGFLEKLRQQPDHPGEVPELLHLARHFHLRELRDRLGETRAESVKKP